MTTRLFKSNNDLINNPIFKIASELKHFELKLKIFLI